MCERCRSVPGTGQRQTYTHPDSSSSSNNNNNNNNAQVNPTRAALRDGDATPTPPLSLHPSPQHTAHPPLFCNRRCGFFFSPFSKGNIRKSLEDIESDLVRSAPAQPSGLQGAALYVNHGNPPAVLPWPLVVVVLAQAASCLVAARSCRRDFTCSFFFCGWAAHTGIVLRRWWRCNLLYRIISYLLRVLCFVCVCVFFALFSSHPSVWNFYALTLLVQHCHETPV